MLNNNIYQVFIRNHTQEGNIQALIKDLNRISEMGFKVLYLMPFHPISVLNRKGSYGSPYAIADYLEISEDLGNKDDMRELLEKAHSLGLSVIMDIVFNHAGADHIWSRTHPQFFILDEKGIPTRKVADWSDIIDYDFSNRDLWNELKKVLIYWAEFGFDGFRCDVASLVPYAFWLEAISTLKGKDLNVKWFSESVDLGFREALSLAHEEVVSDNDILRLFDGSYDYDLWPIQKQAMVDNSKLGLYSELLNYRYGQMLKNKTKWHFVENHDQVRARENGLSNEDYKKWLALVLLYPGMGFVYAGGESKSQPDASFFEKKMINRDFDQELVDWITLLNRIKEEWVSEKEVWAKTHYSNGVFRLDITTVENIYSLYLNFNKENVSIEFLDESVVNELNGTPISVVYGKIELDQEPILTKTRRVYE